MVLIYLTSDECVEVPEAASCEREDDRLVCIDSTGAVVRSFPLHQVSVFTNDPATAELVRDEVCEEECEEDEAPTAALG